MDPFLGNEDFVPLGSPGKGSEFPVPFDLHGETVVKCPGCNGIMPPTTYPIHKGNKCSDAKKKTQRTMSAYNSRLNGTRGHLDSPSEELSQASSQSKPHPWSTSTNRSLQPSSAKPTPFSSSSPPGQHSHTPPPSTSQSSQPFQPGLSSLPAGSSAGSLEDSALIPSSSSHPPSGHPSRLLLPPPPPLRPPPVYLDLTAPTSQANPTSSVNPTSSSTPTLASDPTSSSTPTLSSNFASSFNSTSLSNPVPGNSISVSLLETSSSSGATGLGAAVIGGSSTISIRKRNTDGLLDEDDKIWRCRVVLDNVPRFIRDNTVLQNDIKKRYQNCGVEYKPRNTPKINFGPKGTYGTARISFDTEEEAAQAIDILQGMLVGTNYPVQPRFANEDDGWMFRTEQQKKKAKRLLQGYVTSSKQAEIATTRMRGAQEEHRRQMSEMEQKYKEELSNMEKRYEDDVEKIASALRQHRDQEISHFRLLYEQELSRAEAKEIEAKRLEAMLQEEREAHEKKMRPIKARYGDELGRLVAEMDGITLKHKETHDELVQKHAREMEEQRRLQAEEMAKKVAEYTELLEKEKKAKEEAERQIQQQQEAIQKIRERLRVSQQRLSENKAKSERLKEEIAKKTSSEATLKTQLSKLEAEKKETMLTLECSICMERLVDHIIIPCGHLFCGQCLRDLKPALEKRKEEHENWNMELKCPVCGQPCDNWQPAYLNV